MDSLVGVGQFFLLATITTFKVFSLVEKTAASKNSDGETIHLPSLFGPWAIWQRSS